jgi:invasion protein IalB
MNNFQKCGITGFIVLVMSLGAVSSFAATGDQKTPAPVTGNTVIEKGWALRCPDKKTDQKNCEVFDRLEVKSSALRVVEIAIGFPQDKTQKQGTARGVIILPLGIMLQPGATMKIDEGKPFAFTSRFCTDAGCFSLINISPSLLDTLQKGKTLTLSFKTPDEKDAHVVMDLSGLDKALKKIE